MTSAAPTTQAALLRFFRAIDERAWDDLATLLAERVTLDYVSVFGGQVETLAREEVLARWRGLLPGFDATQHFVAALVDLDGDGVLEGNVRGYHHLDGDTWMVAGWYRLTVAESKVGPQVAGIVLTLGYETGSRELVERAQQRAGG